MSEDTQLAPVPQGGALVSFNASSLTRDQIALIKATVAEGATDDELKLFLYLAQRYDLDPFRHEIWCIKYRRKDSEHDEPATIFTSRDGYLKIAMRDPDYAGIQSFAVREDDDFEINTDDMSVHHRFRVTADRAKKPILGAWARAMHKQRPPVVCFVEFNEYNRPNNPTWKSNPSAMICKVSEVFVLRRQFNISGLVAREEIDLDVSTLRREPRPAPKPARSDVIACNACQQPISSVVVDGKTYTAAAIAKSSERMPGGPFCYACACKAAAPKQEQDTPPANTPTPAKQGTPLDAMWAEWGALVHEAKEHGIQVPVLSFPQPRDTLQAAITGLKRAIAEGGLPIEKIALWTEAVAHAKELGVDYSNLVWSNETGFDKALIDLGERLDATEALTALEGDSPFDN